MSPGGQLGESKTRPRRSTIKACPSGSLSIKARPCSAPRTNTVVAKASASITEGAITVTL